jgi:hypothetical protein
MILTAIRYKSSYLGGSTKKKSLKKNSPQGATITGKINEGSLYNLPLCTSIDNFYITDFICENSAIMAKVSKTSRANKKLKKTSIYS